MLRCGTWSVPAAQTLTDSAACWLHKDPSTAGGGEGIPDLREEETTAGSQDQ